jgi:radical SAM protein with 4Fe4S-binding SPASM domain
VDAVLYDNLVPFQDLKHGEGCLFEDDLEVKTHMERLVTRKSSVDVELPVLLRRDRFTHYCAGYHEFLNVDAMGNVSGCMRDLAPDQGYGNVFRDRHAMNTEHFKETRKMFMNKQLPDRCKVCVEMSR